MAKVTTKTTTSRFLDPRKQDWTPRYRYNKDQDDFDVIVCAKQYGQPTRHYQGVTKATVAGLSKNFTYSNLSLLDNVPPQAVVERLGNTSHWKKTVPRALNLGAKKKIA